MDQFTTSVRLPREEDADGEEQEDASDSRREIHRNMQPTCTWGTMLNLPGKLHGLLQRHGRMLPRGAAEEMLLVKRDLEEIMGMLSKLAAEPAMVVKCWTKEVRELSYDIEDFIDQCNHAATSSRTRSIPRHPISRWRRSKAALPWRRHDKLRQRLWMANKIREFSLRVQEALQRHGMYNLSGVAGAASATTSNDASSSATWRGTTFGDDGVQVGIDAAMNKLEEWLMSIHDGAEKIKVASIIGFGGVGKTTLANKLYRKLGWRFECRAFVRTSQKTDMRRLLISMFSQFRPCQAPHDWTVHSLISGIRSHLQDKRYLIIVDDLWASATWDIIKCALPDSNSYSRIVITTEIEELAWQSCGYDSNYIFKMRPLCEVDSRKLFFSSVFGPHNECPPELREVSNDVIRKCCGSPLAIVTIGGILSSQLGIQEHWDYVNKSLGYSLMKDITLEGMKQVLNLSYNSLPQHLKACMLYTSIYEEDSIIWKDDLVNQWIAEGFICAEGQDKQEISGAYFDELVSRKMIQPVDISDSGEVLSCVVHHMVLNFMANKAVEENFVTAIHHSQATTILSDKVRRLSLHFGNAENAMPPTNMRLSQVRTLAFFGVFNSMPAIVEFRLLQVLILHVWGDTDSISLDFTRISELFRLRYLKVTSNVTLELQAQMRGLQCLETLELDARVSATPSDIAHLQGLLHLKLPAESKLPNGIGHMTSLRTLRYFHLNGNSLDNVMSLRKLTNLRDLQLSCSTVQEPYYLKGKLEFLLDSIHGELSNLKSLTLVPTVSSYGNILNDAGGTSVGIILSGSSVNIVLHSLQRFAFSPKICIFSSLPKCIGLLGKLCILKIGVRKIVRNDVEILRGLPDLAVLSLYVQTRPAETIVIGNTGFSVLKYLKFKCCDPRLEFGAYAVPNLRKLKLGFNAHNSRQQTTMPVGIEHLSGLKEVIVKIGGEGLQGSDRKAAALAFSDAKLAFSDAIRVQTSCPRVTVQCVNKIFGCKEDRSTMTRKEEEENPVRKLQHLYDKTMESGQKAINQADSRFTLSEWHILLLLRNKLDNHHDDIMRAIPVVDVYSVDPWKLAEIGTGLEEPCFYFRPLQETEAWGGTPNQTPSGYWKATGSAEYIYSAERLSVGMKRTMEFYSGQMGSGIKTYWNMKEFIAFPRATAGAIGVAQTLRSKMSLCQLYVESTTISTASAGYNPAKQHDIPKEKPSEQDEIIQNVSERSMNLQADIRRPRPSKKVVISQLEDGFSWRKYGRRDIRGAKHPRRYFRCIDGHTQGCSATKQVQRKDDDPLLYDVVYHGEHTCVQAISTDHDQGSVSGCTTASTTSAVSGNYQYLASDFGSQMLGDDSAWDAVHPWDVVQQLIRTPSPDPKSDA